MTHLQYKHSESNNEKILSFRVDMEKAGDVLFRFISKKNLILLIGVILTIITGSANNILYYKVISTTPLYHSF